MGAWSSALLGGTTAECVLSPLVCPAHPEVWYSFLLLSILDAHQAFICIGLSAPQHSRDIHCSTVSTGTTNLLVLNVDVSLVKGPWGGATRQKTVCLRDLALKRQWQANETAQWVKALVTKDLNLVPETHVVERTNSLKLSSSLSMHTTADGHFTK